MATLAAASSTTSTNSTKVATTSAIPLSNNSNERDDADSSSPQFVGEGQRQGDAVPLWPSPNTSLNLARRWLYVSQAIHQFSEWAWQFCLVLFLAGLTNNESLLFVSTYGFAFSALVAFGTPRMGQMIDRAAAGASAATMPSRGDKDTYYAPRLALIRQWILLEKSCVLLATACCWYFFQQQQQQQQPQKARTGQDEKSFDFGASLQSYSSTSSSWIIPLILVVSIHVLGAMGSLLDVSVLLALERDWIVVMSQQYSHSVRVQNDQEENDHDDDTHYRPNRYQDDRDEEDIARDALDRVQHTSTINSSDPNQNGKRDRGSLWLSRTNVVMKQIDLACQISAPALSGWFIAYWAAWSSSSSTCLDMATHPNTTNCTTLEENYAHGSKGGQQQQHWSGAIVWVATLNILSLVVERICITQIFHLVPGLATTMSSSDTITPLTNRTAIPIVDEFDDEREDENEDYQYQEYEQKDRALFGTAQRPALHHHDKIDKNYQQFQQRLTLEPISGNQDTVEAKVPSTTRPSVSFSLCCHALHVFFIEQATTVSLGGLGLSLLFFNVMTFGGLMTGYLITLGGMSLSTIGLLRGINSSIGLAGTIAFDVSHRILGYSLEFTALWSVTWEFAALSISVLSLVWRTSDPHWSMVCLISGVLPSRIGVHAYDIAIKTVQQQQVSPSVRGLVGGTQTTLNALMELCPFALGLIYSEPSQFHVFVLGGYAAIGLAMTLNMVGVYHVCGLCHGPYQTFSSSLEMDASCNDSDGIAGGERELQMT
jgi:Ferroportin1 (FPN1)